MIREGTPGNRYLVLANSRKAGGRCVAVVDESGTWLRPISRVGTGELSAEDSIHTASKTNLLPLDVVAAEFGKPAPNHYQPEDHIQPRTWEEPEWISPDELSEWLERTVDHDADFLTRDRPDRIGEASARADPLQSSLALVQPDALTIVKTQSFGRKQMRALFTSNDIVDESGEPLRFYLSVTDDSFTARLRGVDADRTTLVPGPGPVYLTVSLGVPYKGDHYKLVAAVITGEEIAQARGRAGVLPF